MNEITLAAFNDELEAITKEAGIGSFLMKGLRGFKSSAKGVKQLGFKKSMGRHGQAIKGMYQRGGGGWGGVKQVAKSPYGAMAAVGAGAAAVPAVAGSVMDGRRAQR